jgi:hypothetical protein
VVQKTSYQQKSEDAGKAPPSGEEAIKPLWPLELPILKISSFELPPFFMQYSVMATIEELAEEEWAEWYRLTPAQRWIETEKLWRTYIQLGGSLDPEPDTQSPFFDPEAQDANPSHGRSGVRVVRRSRV